jgi:hypothetical protein
MYRVLMCAAAGALISSQAVAHQRQQVSFKVPVENIKYIVSHNVDVGDVPNHIVRLFDVHFAIPNNTSTINTVSLAEFLARGTADITHGNGITTFYFVFVVENGDRVFARNTSVVRNASGKITATTVGQITGGKDGSRDSRALLDKSPTSIRDQARRPQPKPSTKSNTRSASDPTGWW